MEEKLENKIKGIVKKFNPFFGIEAYAQLLQQKLRTHKVEVEYHIKMIERGIFTYQLSLFEVPEAHKNDSPRVQMLHADFVFSMEISVGGDITMDNFNSMPPIVNRFVGQSKKQARTGESESADDYDLEMWFYEDGARILSLASLIKNKKIEYLTMLDWITWNPIEEKA